MFFVAAWSYPLAVNFAPSYKKVVDVFYETEIGLQGRTLDEEKIQGSRMEEKETAATAV
jgi:FHS family L-fucose permease-like MFS transporter